jgi:hypothetical protein
MLTRLHVKDLGPIKEAVLDDRAAVTILLGPNEAGKSTLLEALHVLYFGMRGKLAVSDGKAMARDGSKGWLVEATLGETELRATRSSRPLKKDCEETLGDPRVFRSLTYLRYFLGMMPAERKALVADLNATDTAALYEKLEAAGAPAPVLEAVQAGNMKKAHAEAVEARRGMTRLLRDAKEIGEKEVLDVEIETKRGKLSVSQLPLKTIEGSLARIRSRRDKLVKDGFERRAHREVLDRAARAKRDLEELEASAHWEDADETRLLEIGRSIEDVRAKAAECALGIKLSSEALLKFEKFQKDLSPGETMDCPTCTRPLAEEEAAHILKVLRCDSVKLSNLGHKAQKTAGDAMKDLAEERTKLQKRKTTAATQSKYRERLEQAIHAGDGLDVPPEPEEDGPDLNAELTRVGRMRDLRRDYEQAVALQTEANDKIAERQAKEDELRRIEVLCDPAAMDNEAEVLEQLNGLLEKTTKPLGALVEIDPGYGVKIQGRDPSLCADSVMIRAGFGAACALSVISGVGIALLDRFESLDDSNRKKALGVVKGLVDDGLLSTVLIAAVKENPKAGATVPWLAWVKVADGTVEYL